MLRFLVKLAVAALIANAAWRIGLAHLTYYRFKDAVTQAAQFSGDRNAAQIKENVLELASRDDIPLGPDDLTVQFDDRSHVLVDGAYTQAIEVVPGYIYPWEFALAVDVFVVRQPSRGPSGR